MNEDAQELLNADLVKMNWEVVQALLSRTSESRWKVKAAGVVVWWGVVGFSVSKGQSLPILLLLLLIALIFLLDMSLKLREEQLLELNLRIEKFLTALVRGDHASLLEEGLEITTVLPRTTEGFRQLVFRLSRWRFWMPYVVCLVITLSLWLLVSRGMILTTVGPTSQTVPTTKSTVTHPTKTTP